MENGLVVEYKSHIMQKGRIAFYDKPNSAITVLADRCRNTLQEWSESRQNNDWVVAKDLAWMHENKAYKHLGEQKGCLPGLIRFMGDS